MALVHHYLHVVFVVVEIGIFCHVRVVPGDLKAAQEGSGGAGSEGFKSSGAMISILPRAKNYILHAKTTLHCPSQSCSYAPANQLAGLDFA